MQAHGHLLDWDAAKRDLSPLPRLGPRLSREQRQALANRGSQLLVQKRLLEEGLRNAIVMSTLCAAWVHFRDRRKCALADKS
jgi:hypothetical protein